MKAHRNEGMPTARVRSLDALETDAGRVGTLGWSLVEVSVRAGCQRPARLDAAGAPAASDHRACVGRL